MKIKSVYLILLVHLVNIASAQTDTTQVEGNNSFFSTTVINFWSILPLLFSIGVLIYCLMRFSSIDKKKESYGRVNVEDNNQSIQKSNSTQIFSKKEIEKYILDSDKISDINDAISKLQYRLSILENNNSNLNQLGSQSANVQPASQDEIFYIMKPVDDYFPNENKSTSKNDTVYKFTVKSNKTEAVFEIHTGGAPVNDIAKRNEAYIKPACEEENMPGNTVNNIITKRKGIVSLEGDKWVIKTKAVIRYE